jgi:hypothetical protein
MATDESDGHTEDRPQPLFVTTHWSVVLAAGHGDTTRADDALAHLCQTYWYPLYAYARRRGCSPPDAQDLTQEFFARLLKGHEAFYGQRMEQSPDAKARRWAANPLSQR